MANYETNNDTGRAEIRVKGTDDLSVGQASSFSKFAKLTQRLVAVPKEEIDKERERGEKPKPFR